MISVHILFFLLILLLAAQIAGAGMNIEQCMYSINNLSNTVHIGQMLKRTSMLVYLHFANFKLTAYFDERLCSNPLNYWIGHEILKWND